MDGPSRKEVLTTNSYGANALLPVRRFTLVRVSFPPRTPAGRPNVDTFGLGLMHT